MSASFRHKLSINESDVSQAHLMRQDSTVEREPLLHLLRYVQRSPSFFDCFVPQYSGMSFFYFWGFFRLPY